MSKGEKGNFLVTTCTGRTPKKTTITPKKTHQFVSGTKKCMVNKAKSGRRKKIQG